MNLTPLFNRILVKQDNPDEKTPGGIYYPPANAQAPQMGTVIAVGPGQRTEDGKFLPMTIDVGDRVLFGKYSAAEVKIDGVDLLIMTETEILGKVA